MASSSWKSAFSAGILPLLFWLLWAFLLVLNEHTHLGVADLLTRYRTTYALAFCLDVRLALDKRDWKSLLIKPLLALLYAYGPIHQASSALDSTIVELDLILEIFSTDNAWRSWSTFLFTWCHALWHLSVTTSAFTDPTPEVPPAPAVTMQDAGVQTTPGAQPAPAVSTQNAAVHTAPEANHRERCTKLEERWFSVKSKRDDLSIALRDARVAHEQEARQLREDLHNSEAENEALKRDRLQLTRANADLRKTSWKLTKQVEGLTADLSQLASQKPREDTSRIAGWRTSSSWRRSVRVNTVRTSVPEPSIPEDPRAAVANAANASLSAFPGASPAVGAPASSTPAPTTVGSLPASAAPAPVAPLPPQTGSHPPVVVSRQTVALQSALGPSVSTSSASSAPPSSASAPPPAPAAPTPAPTQPPVPSSSQPAALSGPRRPIAKPRRLVVVPEETKAQEQLTALGELLPSFSGSPYVCLECYFHSFGPIITYFTLLKQKFAAGFLDTPEGQRFLQADVVPALLQALPGHKSVVSGLIFDNWVPGKGGWDPRTVENASEQKTAFWFALEDILAALRRARGEEVDIPADPFGLGDWAPQEQDGQESEESEAE